MEKDIYRKVQEQIDQYSFGFPATESGIEIEILKKLFSPEDAEMFHYLSPQLETPEAVASRIGKDAQEVSEKLADMAARGLVFHLKKNDSAKYGAIPFIHGLYEFQITRIDRDLADLVRKYMAEEYGNTMSSLVSGFLRTIPVQQSLDVKHNIASYEDASEILKKAKNIVVTECICRASSKILEEGCEKPREVCFMFGSMGQYYLDHDMGRKVDAAEGLKIIKDAQNAGLVTQPATAQNPAGLCNCCGDCCGHLAALKINPKPAEIVFSNYFAKADMELCTGCGTCEERCQMDAITVNGDYLAEINLDRCIGCGLCVTSCPVEAIILMPKPEDQHQTPPVSSMEQMMSMAQKRGII